MAPAEPYKTKKVAKKKRKSNKTTKNDTVSEYIRDMTTNKYSEFCKNILKGVGLKFSDRYNSKWNIDDLVYQFVLMPEPKALRRDNMLRVLPPKVWRNCRVGYGGPIKLAPDAPYCLSPCMGLVRMIISSEPIYSISFGFSRFGNGHNNCIC